MVERSVIEKFFNTMFGGVPAEYRASAFILPKRLSRRFGPDMGNDFAQWAENENDSGGNIYYGFGLIHQDRELGSGQRGTRADIAGLVAIGLDVDILDDDAHKKGNLPPSESAALAVISSFPKPTVTYNSGHGVQAVWCFAEPIIFRDEEHKVEMEKFFTAFMYTASHKARELGFSIDHTHDITRVFRVPGCVNRKIADHPVPSRIIEWSGMRYGLDVLQQYITTKGKADAEKVVAYNLETIVCGSLVLDLMAEPPRDKFEALLENDPKFVALWSRIKDPDETKDVTPSAYDYRLAIIAAKTGWTDQEICNLLIAARRKHNDKLNFRPNDTYYAPTIAKARKFLETHESKKEIKNVDAEDSRLRTEANTAIISAASTAVREAAMRVSSEEQRAVTAQDIQLPDELRDDALKRASSILGIEVSRVWRYVTSPPTYCVMLNGCRTRSLASRDIDSQTIFRQIVAETTNIRFPKLKSAQWDQVSAALFMAAEVDEGFGENDEVSFCSELLETYLRENVPVEGDDMDIANAMHQNQPFFEADHIYISLMAFANWRDRKGFQCTTKELSINLRHLGADSKRVSKYSKEMGSVSRQMWRLPMTFSSCKKAKIGHGLVYVGAEGIK